MRIGVLSLQGAFAEHIEKIRSLGADAFEIRSLKDIEAPFDGIVLSGGESTAIKKLLKDTGLFHPIQEFINSGMPTLATCAGLILLAKYIDGSEEACFGSMNIKVKRNAYGRQLGSFRCIDAFNGIPIEMPFIRAPFIVEAGENVDILSIHESKIVAARQGKQIATAFHPELTDDDTVYNMFIGMI